MELLQSFGIILIVFIVLTIICIKVAVAFHIRRWYELLLICVFTGGGLGIVLSFMSGLMSFSRFPGVALFIGALMGMTFGLITGGLYLSISQASKTKDKVKNVNDKVKS